jgi:hypothetical protein
VVAPAAVPEAEPVEALGAAPAVEQVVEVSAVALEAAPVVERVEAREAEPEEEVVVEACQNNRSLLRK